MLPLLYVCVYITQLLRPANTYARARNARTHAHKHSRHDTIRNENERISARAATMFFRVRPPKSTSVPADSQMSRQTHMYVNKHAVSLEPGERTFISLFSLSHLLSPSLQRAFYVLRSLSRSHERVARAALSISLSHLVSFFLRRTDTATNPSPPRFFRHLGAHSHTRKTKRTRNTVVEQPKQSRASCSFLLLVVVNLPVVAREKHAHAHSLSLTHIHTTYALFSSVSPFARSVVLLSREPRTRDTPG